jgi:hypothetical protein
MKSQVEFQPLEGALRWLLCRPTLASRAQLLEQLEIPIELASGYIRCEVPILYRLLLSYDEYRNSMDRAYNVGKLRKLLKRYAGELHKCGIKVSLDKSTVELNLETPSCPEG